MLRVSQSDFKKYFSRSFWKALSNAVFLEKSLTPSDKDRIVESLYKELVNKTYYPSVPKIFLHRDKGGGITRCIPVFEIKDYCLYYFCIKRLENKIAHNRVENTFGGWSLGGKLRQSEEEEVMKKEKEIQVFEDEFMAYLGVSIGEYSFNPKAWSKAYGDFNSKLYACLTDGEYQTVVEFDLANFYDSIRLDLLEIWIREIADSETSEEVTLLFHFLNFWNRTVNSYNKQTVGLPQDSLADCSRILANFYLQKYDQYVYDICIRNNCRYLRYADDQFIFAKDQRTLEKIMFQVSKKLNSFGLNINQKKVKYWLVEDLIKYRSFEIFDKVRDELGRSTENVDLFLDEIFILESSFDDLKNRGLPLVNKALSLPLNGIDAAKQQKLLSLVRTEEYLKQAKEYQLSKIYALLNDEEKNSFIEQLEKICMETYHNAFHYTVLNFFKSKSVSCEKVKARIVEIEHII